VYFFGLNKSSPLRIGPDPRICIFDDSFMQVISLTSTIDDGNLYRFVTDGEKYHVRKNALLIASEYLVDRAEQRSLIRFN
jgi:hypothetical protein